MRCVRDHAIGAAMMLAATCQAGAARGQVADPSFEVPALGVGNSRPAPAGSPWTFTDGAGVAANGSRLTRDNQLSASGVQVAYLQYNGSFVQDVAVRDAGPYRLTFQVAQRNNQFGIQDFRVLVDGVVVGTYTPGGWYYVRYATDVFTVEAGSHAIAFEALNSGGGDPVVFVDNVAVEPDRFLTEAGFETPWVGPEGVSVSYAYRPAGSSWTFIGDAGVAANGSGFTGANPPAPEGVQVAFLQGRGTMRQSFLFPESGWYRIGFMAAQRQDWQGTSQDFAVRVVNTSVGTYRPLNAWYRPYVTESFYAYAGWTEVEFHGLNSAGGDNTVFVDAVSVEPAPWPY